MAHAFSFLSPRFLRLTHTYVVATFFVCLMTGCSWKDKSTDHYVSAPGSVTDSQFQAQGAGQSNRVRAPAQIHIGVKRQPKHTEPSIASHTQTYMGTLPCFNPGLSCRAQRMTLTLASNGRWRLRLVDLEESTPVKSKPTLEQGCWQMIEEKQPRVLLVDTRGNMYAEFIVSTNNVLRIQSLKGYSPNLHYHLKRQPDIDPINELSTQNAPLCR